MNIYDNYAEIGDGAEIGADAYIGEYVTVGDSVDIGDHVEIGNFAIIGDCVKVGDYAKIGDEAEIGDYAEIGDGAYLGDCVTVGDKFRCEGLKVIDFFTMSNVDGTGHKIHVYVHTEGITIRAGCFKGTLDEFCMQAEDEGKYVYSMTVRGAAEAFAAAIHHQGKTGGWDK